MQDGHASLLSLASPLTAASVVDAVVFALEGDHGTTHIAVAYEGVASEVALRTAARLGVTLLDATALPEPAPPVDVPPEIGADLLAVELPAHEPEPLLPAHVDPTTPEPEPLCIPPLPWSGPAPEPAVAEVHVSPLEMLALPWHAELGETIEVHD